VRTRLELGCLDILLSHDAIDLAGELPGLLEAADGTERGVLSGFHTGLSRLTGNPALTLFQQVVGALADVVPPREPVVAAGADGYAGPEVITRIRQEHAAIAEAIVSRDIAIARQRMLRHLQSPACGRAAADPAAALRI
jgi:DNA-binding FadR family transcriptional regulator